MSGENINLGNVNMLLNVTGPVTIWTLIHDKIRAEISWLYLTVLEAVQMILKLVYSCWQVSEIGKKLI